MAFKECPKSVFKGRIHTPLPNTPNYKVTNRLLSPYYFWERLDIERVMIVTVKPNIITHKSWKPLAEKNVYSP